MWNRSAQFSSPRVMMRPWIWSMVLADEEWVVLQMDRVAALSSEHPSCTSFESCTTANGP